MPPGTDPDSFTLALVLTAAGATVAATLIASVIEIIKRLPGLGPWLDAGKETALATLFAAVLVIYAYAATAANATDPAGIFAAFLAWVGIAGLAGRAYEVGSSAKATLTEPNS